MQWYSAPDYESWERQSAETSQTNDRLCTDGGRPVDDSLDNAADLSAFQRDALFIISRLVDNSETCYGLAVKRRLEAYYNEQVNHGRLYPNLDTLVEHGLIEKHDEDGRTNRYEITQRGVNLLEDRHVWTEHHLAPHLSNDDSEEQTAPARGDD